MSLQVGSAKYLTQSEIEEVEKSFRIFDQDNSGSISIRQFDQILKSLGQNVPEEELEILIQNIDKDGNGFIDFQQFLELVAPKLISNRTEKQYLETFRLIDQKNDGVLDKEELTRANQIAGSPLNQKEIQEIMVFVEAKYGPNFNLETVFKMMLRKPVAG